MLLENNRISFQQYLARRGFDKYSTTNLLLQMFPSSLIQPGFLKFWRRWNPFCGYILFLLYVHFGGNKKRNIAVSTVFLLSGFIIHDMLIFIVTGIFSFVFSISFLFYSVLFTINSFQNYEKYIYNGSKLRNVFLNICSIISGLKVGYSFNCLIFPNSIKYHYLSL
jgi:hypothetical protein